VAKHTLNFPSEYDFELVALASYMKDYKLCWSINKHLQCAFELSDNYITNVFADKSTAQHPMYYYRNEEMKEQCFLLPNTTHESCLIQEFKNFPYLLILKNFTAVRKTVFLESLKALTEIVALVPVEVESLKNKKKLLF
jgi:hypothetical protein